MKVQKFTRMQIFLFMLGLKEWEPTHKVAALVEPFSLLEQDMPDEFKTILANASMEKLAYYCFGDGKSLTRPSFPLSTAGHCHYAVCRTGLPTSRITMTETESVVLTAYTCVSCHKKFHLRHPRIAPRIRNGLLYIDSTTKTVRKIREAPAVAYA